MVKQEVLLECFALCMASVLALTTAFGDVHLMHPVGGGGMIISDFDTPDHAYISTSPFGGSLVQSVDLGDSVYALGGGYQSPLLSGGLRAFPPYGGFERRRMSYPSRRYGKSRRMRLVPV